MGEVFLASVVCIHVPWCVAGDRLRYVACNHKLR